MKITLVSMLAQRMVAGLLGMAGTAAGAAVITANYPDFVVDESAFKSSLAQTFVADKITGNYVEVITFSGTTFDVALKWNAGQFVANDGTDPVKKTLLNAYGIGYGLYALYNTSGTFSSAGGLTTFTFTNNGGLNLFLDPNYDTDLIAPSNGAAAWTATSNADDVLLATGVPVSGEGALTQNAATCPASGQSQGGNNCGSFGTASMFALTTEGRQYFMGPNPFYSLSFQSGQLSNFVVGGTQTFNGAMDIAFGTTVPEPTSVALLGMGLLALVTFRRSSSKNQARSRAPARPAGKY